MVELMKHGVTERVSKLELCRWFAPSHQTHAALAKRESARRGLS
jgi:hypothetical protein